MNLPYKMHRPSSAIYALLWGLLSLVHSDDKYSFLGPLKSFLEKTYISHELSFQNI